LITFSALSVRVIHLRMRTKNDLCAIAHISIYNIIYKECLIP